MEDFLDERSDFAIGVDEIAERFADEGEPANLLIPATCSTRGCSPPSTSSAKT